MPIHVIERRIFNATGGPASVPADFASGVGAAVSPTVTVSANAGPATGSGLAWPPATTDGPQVLFGKFESLSRVGSGRADGQATGGGFVTTGANNAQNYEEVTDDFMDFSRVHQWRYFYSNIPSSDATGAAARGITLWLSFKPTVTQMQALRASYEAGNTTDAQLAADPTVSAVRTQLRTMISAHPVGTKWICWHEPESHVNGGARVLGSRFDAIDWAYANAAFYTILKALRPDDLLVASHLCYLWRTGIGITTGTARNNWIIPDSKVDAIGLDAYLMEFQLGRLHHFQFDGDGIRLCDAYLRSVYTDKPFGFTELGITGEKMTAPLGSTNQGDWVYTTAYTDADRAAVLQETFNQALARGYKFFLWWHGLRCDYSANSGGQQFFRNHHFHPSNSRGQTFPLALAKWNELVSTYGITGEDIP